MTGNFLAKLSRLIVHTFFREIIIQGQEHLPKGIPVIFAANHPNSLLDPLLLQLFSPEYGVRFVAKFTLFKIPLFGGALRKARAIPVVRRMDAAGAVDYTEFFSSCLQALKEGDSIGIFPEGTSLPQPFMAPLRTGTARLFFMARESRVQLAIVPIGLNYEKGSVFRSSVLISVAMPVDTSGHENIYQTDPVSAVRELTETLSNQLEKNVFQAENFRDRELMILLERLYHQDQEDDRWGDRLGRLKQFESGLAQLQSRYPSEIQRLRNLLSRYQRLSDLYGIEPDQKRELPRPRLLNVMPALGILIAAIGWLFNWIPYRLCSLFVKLARRDESQAATSKVVCSLFLFPVTYVLEGMILWRRFGWKAGLAFAIVILPLTYFTLRFFEWREETRADLPKLWLWFSGGFGRASKQLSRLRTRIIREVETLAAELART